MKNHPNKDRAILAAGIAVLALVAGACADAVGPNESTVASSSSPVSTTTTATSEPKITPVTEPDEVIGSKSSSPVSQAAAEDDILGIPNTSVIDMAALATLNNMGVYCPSDDACLNAVASVCMYKSMGYTSNDLYVELAMDPYAEQIMPPFSNDDIPYFFGVAEGGYCEGM